MPHFASAAPATAEGAGSATWTPLGPSPIQNTGANSGTVNASGRIASIAVHPTNSQIIYIGAASGGVWKTTNGGTTWTALTDAQCGLAMGSTVIDPVDPNIVYMAMGELNVSGDSYARRRTAIVLRRRSERARSRGRGSSPSYEAPSG
jgi:hypothetical protein